MCRCALFDKKERLHAISSACCCSYARVKLISLNFRSHFGDSVLIYFAPASKIRVIQRIQFQRIIDDTVLSYLPVRLRVECTSMNYAVSNTENCIWILAQLLEIYRHCYVKQ